MQSYDHRLFFYHITGRCNLQQKAGEHSSPLRCVLFLFVGAICDRPLGRGIQHIFDEDAVAGCGVVHKNMGDGADELAVLDNGTAGHFCVKYGTKEFCVFLLFLRVFACKRQAFAYITRNP